MSTKKRAAKRVKDAKDEELLKQEQSLPAKPTKKIVKEHVDYLQASDDMDDKVILRDIKDNMRWGYPNPNGKELFNAVLKDMSTPDKK